MSELLTARDLDLNLVTPSYVRDISSPPGEHISAKILQGMAELLSQHIA